MVDSAAISNSAQAGLGAGDLRIHVRTASARGPANLLRFFFAQCHLQLRNSGAASYQSKTCGRRLV